MVIDLLFLERLYITTTIFSFPLIYLGSRQSHFDGDNSFGHVNHHLLHQQFSTSSGLHKSNRCVDKSLCDICLFGSLRIRSCQLRCQVRKVAC